MTRRKPTRSWPAGDGERTTTPLTLLAGETLYAVDWEDRGKDKLEECWNYAFQVTPFNNPQQQPSRVYVWISTYFTEDWSDALGGYPSREDLQFVAASWLKAFLDKGLKDSPSTPVVKVPSEQAERLLTASIDEQAAYESAEDLFRCAAAVNRRAVFTPFDVAVHLRASVTLAEDVCTYLVDAQVLQAADGGYRLNPARAGTASQPHALSGYTPNPPDGVPVTLLKVMIAAPGDVRVKVEVVKAAIEEWNVTHAVTERVVLLPWHWEQVAVPGSGEYAQMVLNKQLTDQAHMIVAVFGNRLGTPTPAAPSGTAEELQRFLDSGRPFLAYFSNEPLRRDVNREELDRLEDFQRKLRPHVLYGEYDNEQHLRDQVTRGLTRKVRELCGRPQ